MLYGQKYVGTPLKIWSKETWFKESRKAEFKWPAHSPDFNQNEHPWIDLNVYHEPAFSFNITT